MLEINQTQRYYYFIALSGRPNERIKSGFYSGHGIEKTKWIEIGDGCSLQRLRFQADPPFLRRTAELPENGQRPSLDGIIYDHRRLGITVLGFPLKTLTVRLTASLVNEYKLRSTGNFINVDMAKLITQHEQDTDQSFQQGQFYLAGVELALSGDRYLSTVKLQGDKPLDSDLYLSYFKPRVRQDTSHLERCTMKCKIAPNPDLGIPRIVSSLQIDKFGNFKFYVHAKAQNLIALPTIFDYLSSIDCMSETPYAPTTNGLTDEDEI